MELNESALVRHFQPRVHHIWMSDSLPCIICILLLLFLSFSFASHVLNLGSGIEAVSAERGLSCRNGIILYIARII